MLRHRSALTRSISLHPSPFVFLKTLKVSNLHSAMAKRVVDVLVPVALDHAYSYRVPEDLELAPGDLVCVPLGARAATAVVWNDNLDPNPRLDNRLRDIEDKLEVPALKPELRRFIEWVSAYTLAPRGLVLRMCLR